ncbi:MAG: sigma-70 family RNA polymerase sigma factor [Gemmatimonadetes bacterium]|nr:sigma-70 family RNA polymerase sigma factor [Gemmatimonadota bacterium]
MRQRAPGARRRRRRGPGDLIRVWDLRREWRPRGSLQAYLYRIARNLALNERRRLRVRARGTPAASSGGTSDPIERLERLELARTVERAIVSLPERRRQVFLLARFHDLTYAEIAESLDLSPQTVANQMSAALAQLRRLLLPALVGAVEE